MGMLDVSLEFQIIIAIAQYSDWLWAGDWGSVPSRDRDVSLNYHVQTGSRVHSPSCPVCTGMKWPEHGAYFHSIIHLHGMVFN
jgi:hypothetical protein